MNEEMCVDCRKVMAPTEEAYLVENGAICRMCKLRRTSMEMKAKTRVDVLPPAPPIEYQSNYEPPRVQTVEKLVFKDRILIHRVEGPFNLGFMWTMGAAAAGAVIFLLFWIFLIAAGMSFRSLQR